MKKIAFAFLMMLGVLSQAFGNDAISETIMKEWTTFRKQVDTIKPEGDIGGYMLYRDYGNMTLLWRTSKNTNNNEVIRFFMKRDDGKVFAVTYHKTHEIIPGTLVVRRFVGTEPTGWINHTVDFITGEYLGSQGAEPTLTADEEKMMKEWGITNL